MGIILRDYQAESVHDTYAYWKGGGGNPLVAHATGTGKTLVIADVAARFVRAEGRVLVVAHVMELVEQDVTALLELWPDAPVGVNCAGLKRREWDQAIIIATIGSIFRSPEKLGRIDLLIVDESHRIPRRRQSMYQKLIEALRLARPGMRVLGLTATPWRLDTGRLDEGEDRIFDQVVHEYSMADGIRDGWLAPLVCKAPRRGEISVKGVKVRGGEFVADELQAAADKDELIEGAVEDIIGRAGERKSWLVFASGVLHALHIRDAMRAKGVSCETINYATPADERGRIIEEFRAGRIRCLASMDVLTTGFNVKCVDVIALLRATMSTGLLIQMAGRGTRKAEGKENCLLLDYAGNLRRHGPLDAPNIQMGKEGSGDGTEKAKKATRICPECDAVPGWDQVECMCGYKWPLPELKHAARADDDVEVLAGSAPRLVVINDVGVRRHVKWGAQPGDRPTACVEFRAGLQRYLDFLALEHDGYARDKAVGKWAAMGGQMPAPRTVGEAVRRQGELRVGSIMVKRKGKWWEVLSVQRKPGPPDGPGGPNVVPFRRSA
jgi:DNA repair protein RadD